MSTANDWVWLARIRRPQGRKGEVFADLLTDFPERFAERKKLFLLRETADSSTRNSPAIPVRSAQAATGPREVELVHHWPHKGGIVLHFAGIESINDAETLSGLLVVLPETERAPLGEGEYYISDLVGCSLFDVASGTPVLVGVIDDVDRSAGPIALLEVKGKQGEILVPFANAFIKVVDITAKRVEMALPEGLVDVNS